MLTLHVFSSPSRSFAKTTLLTDSDLGRLFGAMSEDPAEWRFDYDTLWRELVVYSSEPDAAGPRLEALLARTGIETSGLAQGLLGVEAPLGPGEGMSKRSYVRNKTVHTAEVTVQLEPTAPGSGLTLVGIDSPYDPVLAHGVRRATRFGPKAHFPVSDVRATVRFAAAGGLPPALADLHAAATHAATRALQSVTMQLLVAPGGAPAPEGTLPFPDLENSAAETCANLVEVFAYPVDVLGEEEKSLLGSFIAYQVSLLFGHQLDERMRRQPGLPPTPLRPLLGLLADRLARQAAEDARPGAEMVGELLAMWVKNWHGATADAAATLATPPSPATVTAPAPVAPALVEDEEDEDESGC